MMGSMLPAPRTGEAIPWRRDPPADQRPDEAPLLRQEPEPGLAVGGDPEIRPADVPGLDPDRLVPDHDRRLGGLLTREREVEECGGKSLRGMSLEEVRQDGQE